ncbi:MAG TPA: IclR family transcriptional regulator C-terminal domain-containing protein [Rugosimonospora sp.]
MVQATSSVTIAAKVLKLLTRYRLARATLTQIAVELAVPKTSCSRILKALVEEGLLAYDPLTKLYSLGPYAIVIGSRAGENVDYLGTVRAALEELATRTSLTAAWIQRVESRRLMYVAKQEGTAHTHVSISIGNRFPLNEVSWGQWVVAYADPQDQKEILADGLPRVSDTNITDPDEYLAHAMSCRELGILTTSGDYMPGIWAASAPVVTHDQKLVGILAIIGVADVLADDERTRAAEVMQEVGRRTVISQPAG